MSTRNAIVFLAAVCLVLFLGACNPYPLPQGLTPVPSLAPGATLTLVPAIQGANLTTPGGVAGKADPGVGAAIYEKNCTLCHGVDGQGGIGLPLRNSNFIQNSDDQTIINVISLGRANTAMPAWLISAAGPLTVIDIQDAAAYLRTLQNVSPIAQMTPAPTATAAPPTAEATQEPARPSNSGGNGEAVNLTGSVDRGIPLFGQYCATCHGPQGVQGAPNPGSDDGSVPELNPIDPTIANADHKIFAQNVDLFVEHGSVPEGDNPRLIMPSFGDAKMLTPQQIADLIAYVISINPK